MQVILLDQIIGLGKKSEIVNVKSGYARNFLIPKNKGIPATKENINLLKKQITKLKLELLNIFNKATSRSKNFIKIIDKIIIKSRSSKEGKLFGSIGRNNIFKEIKNMGYDILKKEIILPKGALKILGNHEVYFKFHEKIIIKKNIQIINF
ncbi:50S ribosomal protein L9 [Enterobacteriaceae endosymbiont of Plateumaris pusilla]|uniref:50S ribosomal protein L9 n=1 Tax=Enterobacteriaceae endosymbiont of Plateumaris pusilla TaxID=2675795 RepID=UPI001448D84F|nr:50S ribosomal protein L9 [Enterobacteriaceae endosymbiont of Plateumaris pusilla]QJC29632.1 50S ribosomal protein L9 [Enterobacteriaceae endosymbiont of Plateumaris pusilla]